MFVPAQFPLFEFDDSAAPGKPAAKRWLPGWQGIVGQAAEEVGLGWAGSDGRQAVVSTALPSRHSDQYNRRHNAVFLLLGGDQLTVPSRPADATMIGEMMHEFARDDEMWAMNEVTVDAQPVAAATASINEAIVGYLSVGERLACFATVGLGLSTVRLRTLTEAAASMYPASPIRQLSTAQLDAQLL